MKNKIIIRDELNLTQQELATLLNTTRSQLALYETGLRELSADSLVRLSMAATVLSSAADENTKHFSKIVEMEVKKDQFIAEALKKNEFDQIACERKITATEKKYQAASKILHLISFSENPKNKNEALHDGALLMLKSKAEEMLKKYGPQESIKLEIKRKMLQQEQQLLSSYLK